ncbi:hypothetical protein R1sor_019357 [Riccia sorocarpa]|uniref:Uncharacterized protein n=1 Tax=Riccia sorocarpa TaxID=122646 RepID=A0ABD3IFX9_9MARC
MYAIPPSGSRDSFPPLIGSALTLVASSCARAIMLRMLSPELADDEGVAAGGMCFHLLDAQGNIKAARETASTYRTHFSVPAAPGGGPGPALRIASFSSVNMAWW